MFKRIGALAMVLAGGLAVLTPAVAQASDRDDYRYDRHVERRDFRDHDRRDFRRDERREWREHEWREHERRRPNYYHNPYTYDRFGRPIYR